MNTAKKCIQTCSDNPKDHLQLFERLSNKGVFKSMQLQMRKAISEELNQNEKKPQKTVESNKKMEINGEIGEGHEENEHKRWESLAKVSSIANWEKMVRYELEIEREIQTKEIERQKEKIKNEWRKLDEKDRTLRIELDARERKLRHREESVRNDLEEINGKITDLEKREQMINEIVAQKTKMEINEELEKLRKKFYELEQIKSHLLKKEDQLMKLETQLREQAIIVKEKIDKRKDNEIEFAKFRKEYEIMKNENEILKKRLDEVQDYKVVRFENNNMKNEMKAIKSALQSKVDELESAQHKWNSDAKIANEKMLKLKMEIKKLEQESALLKQKHEGEMKEWSEKHNHLAAQLEHFKSTAQKLVSRNHQLSKEIITTQNTIEKLTKSSHKPNTQFTSSDCLDKLNHDNVGCQICEHTSNPIKDSSMIFLSDYIDDLKREAQLIGDKPTVPSTSNAIINSSLSNLPNDGNNIDNHVPSASSTNKKSANSSNSLRKEDKSKSFNKTASIIDKAESNNMKTNNDYNAKSNSISNGDGKSNGEDIDW